MVKHGGESMLKKDGNGTKNSEYELWLQCGAKEEDLEGREKEEGRREGK